MCPKGHTCGPAFVLVKNNNVWMVTAFRSLPQLKSKLTPADMR